jgi:predicted permease
MEAILQDIRFALRQLRSAPGFTATAVLTLALAIGANTAIFSLLDQALLRTLPVREANRLVLLEDTGTMWQGSIDVNGGDVEAYFTYPMYRDLRDKSQVFDGLFATDQAQIGVQWNHQSSLAQAELVSGNYFDILGVRPEMGRVLSTQDDKQIDGSPVAVLGFNYWKTHFGQDTRVLNQTISINGNPFTIVGVAQPGFESAIWGSPADLFVPITMAGQVMPGRHDLNGHFDRWLNILGRLKRGETREHATASLAPLWHSLRADDLKMLHDTSPKFVADFLTNNRLRVLDGAKGFSYRRNDIRIPLVVMGGMVLLVILMASVNVAGLLLVRAAGRAREFSMRYALGAERSRVVRQLLVEGLLLGTISGVVALAVAPAATRLLLSSLRFSNGAALFSNRLDLRVLAFNFAVAILVSVLFSIAPVAQFWRPDLIGPMKQQSGVSGGGSIRFRQITVGLQIGLSLLLLVFSGLFVRTLSNLRNVNVGFATDHLLTFGIDPELAGYKQQQIVPLHQRLRDALSHMPGVLAVGATDDPELAGNDSRSTISIAGETRSQDDRIHVEAADITVDYFSTLKIPLVAGRVFNEQDTLDHPHVAVINDAFAKKYFGSAQRAIGRIVGRGAGNAVKYDIEIVGVVGDALHKGMKSDVRPTFFRPLLQTKEPGGMVYYVRTASEPASMSSTIRNAVQQIDSKLVVDTLRTMDAQIDDNIGNERMIALLAVAFGGLATLMAGIGLYGVLAFATTQRTREIGVRMALGANRGNVVRLVLRDVLLLAGISILVTVPIAIMLTRSLRALLYNVSNADPLTLVSVTLLIAVVAIVAAAVPAGRAASVDPSRALRAE